MANELRKLGTQTECQVPLPQDSFQESVKFQPGLCTGDGCLPQEPSKELPQMDREVRSKIPPHRALNIELRDLSVCVQTEGKGYKTILKGVSGRFRSGQLTAILGPSGAGKSTLMNVAAGYRTKNVSGEVLINGQPRNVKTFRKQSCYIMQENHLLPYLSVHECMMAAASLKLGDTISRQHKSQIVGDILETFGLVDCRQTRVANLSGGEKKRLSIAQELVNNPPVMFFDEPTSGLDSQNSFHCINMLQALAREGRTIVCIIHQPSGRILEKFDHLYALAEGQCVYRGSVPGLVPFLHILSLECPSYYNPADFLVEISSDAYGPLIPQLVAAVNSGVCADLSNEVTHHPDIVKGEEPLDPECKAHVNKVHDMVLQIPEVETHLLSPSELHLLSDFSSSFWTQFSVLFKRTFLSIVRDSMLTKLRVIVHVSVGIFMGILYFNIGNEASQILDNISCLFFSIITLIFTAMMSTILTFPVEMNVFLREHLNHWYTVKAYYFAKTMADVPFQILFPVMYLAFMYFMTGQPLDIVRCGLFTFICILTSLAAQSIGLAIGAAVDIQQAVFLGPASTVPTFLFSGFFVTFSTIPVWLQWLTYTSYVRFSFVAALLSLYGLDREKLHCSEAFCLFRSPEKILEHFSIENSFLWLEILLLFVHFLLMRWLCYVILVYRLKSRR